MRTHSAHAHSNRSINERRGAAMGIVMSSFSLASIFGVPFGLYLANRLSWHASFYLLALLSFLIIPIIWWVMPGAPTHYGVVGIFSTVIAIAAIILAQSIREDVLDEAPVEPAVVNVE